MNGVEIARQIAESLHLQAVASGADAWSPLTFALAEAKRIGLDAEPTQKGSAQLGGSRACFVKKMDLILYEDAGTDFDKAFLVAHELGHIHLEEEMEGEDKDPAPYNIDPARAAEASPIGMERVVDHGRRQRREVQMDLFARELLLPRSVAKRLHIDEEMTASDIAAKLGAPFDVVAQQLLDALLLPSQEALTRKENDAEPDLNRLQKDAAEHEGSAYLLEAGPGTGKTKTLVGRVKHLLERGVDPQRILVLTFSNKAAGEISERIAVMNAGAAAVMWTGTFHAFGLDLLRRFHAELGLPGDPRLLDKTEAVELLENEFPRIDLAHYRDIYDPTDNISEILKAISRAKDEVVFVEGYEALAQAMKTVASDESTHEAADKAIEVARVYRQYERLKAAANAVDFGDLVSLPVKLLEENGAIRSQLRDTYDHVLVDEYQDVNRSSVRLLEALRGEGQGLWVVGDAKQSIYRFRGASSYNMERFGKADFAGAERGRLEENYRSVEEISNAFTQFASEMKVSGPDNSAKANRGLSGELPQVRRVAQKDEQVVAIADAILEMRADGHAFRDQAVLCTGNDKLSEIAKTLERLEIPVLFLGSLFERQEVKELLAVLTLLVDRRAVGLLRTACIPDFEMSLQDVCAVVAHLRDSEVAGAWRPSVAPVPGISEQGGAALDALDRALAGFGSQSKPWGVLTHLILDSTGWAKALAQSDKVSDQAKAIAIWQLLNFIRAQPSGQGLPIQRLTERIRRLVRLADEKDLRQLPAAATNIEAVRLMTIHGAKGLEFEVVHLPGMNADTLPRSVYIGKCPPPDGLIAGAITSSKEHHAHETFKEQECLFFVALSRARDRLLLYAVDFKGKQARAISPFVNRIASLATIACVEPSREAPVLPEHLPVEFIVDGPVILPGHEVQNYVSCGRRFLYSHLIQIGGKATTTAFVLMHDAIRRAYKAIVEGQDSSQEAVRKHLEGSFVASKLSQHGYAADYLGLAEGMLAFFKANRNGMTAEAPVGLSLSFADEQVVVMPDDVLIGAGGHRVYRKISTGRTKKDAEDDLGVVALLMAARQAYPQAVVELVYLADQAVLPLEITQRKLGTRQEKVGAAMQDVRAGKFNASPSAFTCPKCPAFFVCGTLPAGALHKTF
jgi:superfamily I DNA/RNA helicase